MPFPTSPANNERYTTAGRTWRWDAARSVWQPLLGWQPASDLAVSPIISGNQSLGATNTQQALQGLFQRAVEGGGTGTGTIPQGPEGATTSLTGNPGMLPYGAGGLWLRYASADTPMATNQTTSPMPPGWSSGMNGPALMTDSTARMSEADGAGWGNTAVQGVNTRWDQLTLTPGQFTIGCWAFPRPGGQKRYAEIWTWTIDPSNHNVQFVWDPVDGSIPAPPNTSPPLGPGGTDHSSGVGGTTVNAYGVYRHPSGWTFGWMQINTTWTVHGFSNSIADRFTPGTPGQQFWPGSPATSGIYWWRHYVARGYVSVPNLLDGAGPEPGDNWPETAPGQVRAYYIAANGSDTNPGNRDQPWATVSRVNSHTKAPGDAFMFRAGDTFSGQGIHALGPAANGTAANPIFYRSYGSRASRATITPGTASISGSIGLPDTRDCGFYLRNASYNRISDLRIVGTGSTNGINFGVFFEANTHDLSRYYGNEIRNLEVTECGRIGIAVGSTPIGFNGVLPPPPAATVNPGFTDIIIENCSVHDNNDGIQFWGIWDEPHVTARLRNQHRNVIIRNIQSYRNHGIQQQLGDVFGGTMNGNGIVVAGIDGGLIENFVAYENGMNNNVGCLGMWIWDSNNVTFRHCESYRNHCNGTDGGGFDIDGGSVNVTFEYCYSHDNRGAGLQSWIYDTAPYTGNNTYRFCVTQNDSVGIPDGSVQVGSSDSRQDSFGTVTYHNCVFFQSQSRNLVSQLGGMYLAKADFFNCIVARGGGSGQFVTNGTNGWMRFNGNNWVGTGQFNWQGTNYANLAAWRAATGNPERLAGADTGGTWAHGLINAGNGGTLTPVGQAPSAALFAAWLPYQLNAGSQNRGAGLNIQQHFSVNPGPQDMFGNPIQASALSIGAHSPGAAPDPGTEWAETAPGQLRARYIAANGNNSNNGSKESPWATVAAINSFAKQAGDAFMFRAGDTFSGTTLLLDQNIGTATNPLFFRSYGSRSSRATIQPATGTDRDSIDIINSGNNRISDLILLGRSTAPNTGTGIFMYADTPNLTRYPGNQIRNVEITGFRDSGMHVGGGAFQRSGATITRNPGFSDLLIENCDVHHNHDGIQIWGYTLESGDLPHQNVTVRDTRSYRNYGSNSFNSGNGLFLGNVNGGLVERCVTYENGESGGSGPLGMWTYNSIHVRFRFCESYGNFGGSSDGGGFDIDGGAEDCWFEYCYSHDNEGPGLQYVIYANAPNSQPGVTVRDNGYRFCVSQNDGSRTNQQAAIRLDQYNGNWQTYPKCIYHNNVVYRNSLWLILETGSTIADLFNNIFVSAGAHTFVQASQGGITNNTLRFRGNNWVGSAVFRWPTTQYTTLAAWRTASQQERLNAADVGRDGAHGLNNAGNGGRITPVGQTPTEAMFAAWNPYKLASGSANLRAGLNIQQHFSINPGPQDMFGNTVSATALSIGAYSPP